MLHNYHTQFKLAALTFSMFMTLAVNSYLLVQFDSLAQVTTAQITLPSVTIVGRSA